MTLQQTQTMLVEAARYPLALRVAARFHLAGVTRSQFVRVIDSFLTPGTTYRTFSTEVFDAFIAIRDGQLKVDPRLAALAEELSLP